MFGVKVISWVSVGAKFLEIPKEGIRKAEAQLKAPLLFKVKLTGTSFLTLK